MTLSVIILEINGNINNGDEESCYSYAGGHVYPQGSGTSDHQLQYTKAVSM